MKGHYREVVMLIARSGLDETAKHGAMVALSIGLDEVEKSPDKFAPQFGTIGVTSVGLLLDGREG